MKLYFRNLSTREVTLHKRHVVVSHISFLLHNTVVKHINGSYIG